MERIEKTTNEELKELLVELKATDTKITELVAESEKAKEEFDKTIMLRQKTVDMMKPIVEDEFKDTLSEFEILASVNLTDAGEIEVKIINELEAWKDSYLKSKQEKVAEPEKVEDLVADDTK